MKNIFKINCIIMAFIFIIINSYTSCTIIQEEPQTNQIPSWAAALDGIEGGEGTDQTCDCNSTNRDVDCDYSYFHAGAICDIYGREESSDEYMYIEDEGVINFSDDYALHITCDIPVYYWQYLGYDVTDIGQIKIYGVEDNHDADTKIDVDLHAIGTGTSGTEFDPRGECDFNTNSSSVSSCEIDSVSIDASYSFVYLDILIPSVYNSIDDSYVRGFRVCYKR